VAGATAASAHTPSISASCEALTVNLSNFQPIIPGRDAVTHTEYLFEHAPNGKYMTRWESDRNWNAQGNPNSTGWRLVDPLQTRTVTDEAATPRKANHVTVTINGAAVADTDFGASYNETFAFANKYQANTWSVTWTAYDDSQYSGSRTGTSSACALPNEPAKDAVASASTTPGTCLAQGGVTFAIEHATWDDIADTSDGSRTATAAAGHLFADGSTSATVTYTIPRQTPWTDAACQPTFEVTQVCGNVTITYHNTSKWDRWPDYRIEGDGVPSKDAGSGPYYTAVKVPAGQTAVILDHDFVEDYNGGSATVTYQDILGAERDIDTAAQTVTVDTDCAPPVTNQVCVAPAAGDTSTNLHPTWTASDTRSAGHYEYVDGGLHIWTTDATSNAKVAMRHAASFPLKNTGTIGIDYSATTGTSPGVQLYVNFDGTNTGTLVYEPVYGQDLWLTGGSSDTVKNNAPVNGGGNGSTWHGTIDQWLTKFPDAQVVGIGFSLGSGVLGDGVLHSITAGCTQYFFDYAAAPQTPPVVVVPPVTPPGPPVVVPPVTSIPPQVGGVKVTAPPTAPSTVPVVTPTVEGVKHEAAAALPRTGTEAGWYGAAGILLLMAGSGLVLVSRRRTARH
jgi:LPXTG-motif cell wall-anchored protein